MVAPELRKKAEQLFVVELLKLKDISKQLKIPVATLKNWSAKFNWQAQREYGKKFAEMMPKVNEKILEDIMKSNDPQATAQLVNAFSGLKKATEGLPVKQKEVKTEEIVPVKSEGLTEASAEEIVKNILGEE